MTAQVETGMPVGELLGSYERQELLDAHSYMGARQLGSAALKLLASTQALGRARFVAAKDLADMFEQYGIERSQVDEYLASCPTQKKPQDPAGRRTTRTGRRLELLPASIEADGDDLSGSGPEAYLTGLPSDASQDNATEVLLEEAREIEQGVVDGLEVTEGTFASNADPRELLARSIGQSATVLSRIFAGIRRHGVMKGVDDALLPPELPKDHVVTEHDIDLFTALVDTFMSRSGSYADIAHRQIERVGGSNVRKAGRLDGRFYEMAAAGLRRLSAPQPHSTPAPDGRGAQGGLVPPPVVRASRNAPAPQKLALLPVARAVNGGVESAHVVVDNGPLDDGSYVDWGSGDLPVRKSLGGVSNLLIESLRGFRSFPLRGDTAIENFSRHDILTAMTGVVVPEHAVVMIDSQEPWEARSTCSQTDPDSFFPDKGGSTREAKRICKRCDVRSECLEIALGGDERFGIWGGLSERERRKTKKQAV